MSRLAALLFENDPGNSSGDPSSRLGARPVGSRIETISASSFAAVAAPTPAASVLPASAPLRRHDVAALIALAGWLLARNKDPPVPAARVSSSWPRGTLHLAHSSRVLSAAAYDTCKLRSLMFSTPSGVRASSVCVCCLA